MSDIENKTPETDKTPPPSQTEGYTLEQVGQKAAELVEKTKRELEFNKLGGEEGITKNIFDRIKFNLRHEFSTEALRQAEAKEFQRIQEAGADTKFKADLSALIHDGYWYLTSTQQHGENGRLLFLYNPYHKETPTKVVLLKLAQRDPGFRRDDRGRRDDKKGQRDDRGRHDREAEQEEGEEPIIEVSSTTEVPPQIAEAKDAQFAQFDAAVKEEYEKVHAELKTLASQWQYRSNDQEYLRNVVKKIDEFADFKSTLEEDQKQRRNNAAQSDSDIRGAIYNFLGETGPFPITKVDELMRLHAVQAQAEKDQIKIAMAGGSGPMEGE